MMKKTVAFALAALFAAGLTLQAQEVALKNGALYTGYVSEQNTSGNARITYTAARFTAPGDSLQIYSTNDRTEIRWRNRIFESVELLEEGDMVTFETTQPGTVSIKVSDIEWISYPCSDAIRDVVVATDKSYTGFLVENVVGKYVKMDVDGRMVTIADSKIRSQSKISADKDKSLNIKMFPYLDIYEIKGMPTLTGALISQNYTDGSAIFLTRDGSLMPLAVDKITNIRKIPNEAYDVSVPEEKDTVDVRINGSPAKWLDVKIDKKEVVTFKMDDLTKNMVAVPDNFVAVNRQEGKPALMLLPFDPFAAKTTAVRLGKLSELEDGIQVKPSTTSTTLGRSITEYEKVEPGFYLLLDKDGSRVAPLWVTGK